MMIHKELFFLILLYTHSTVFSVKLYKDILSGDEMFSDNNKIKLVDEVLYEVYGKLVITNSSSEADEALESGTFVDIVNNHHLAETHHFDNKRYAAYLKEYTRKIVEILQEKNPDQVDVFKANINKVIKELVDKTNDLQFFTGESMDHEGMVVAIEYKEVDGINDVPVLYAFKHGLEEQQL